jgi:hypothetical protein
MERNDKQLGESSQKTFNIQPLSNRDKSEIVDSEGFITVSYKKKLKGDGKKLMKSVDSYNKFHSMVTRSMTGNKNVLKFKEGSKYQRLADTVVSYKPFHAMVTRSNKSKEVLGSERFNECNVVEKRRML